ncbi:MAG: hypothetical protein ACFBSC_16565 [Microcoleaceae cyanobacterium]
MSSTSHPKSSSILAAQNVVIFGMVWAVFSLLFFMLFSVTPEGEELPGWYAIGTYIFELGAFLLATIVCYRNWKSPQMVSGRNVWLGIGLGAFFYFLGGVFFGVWELVWELDPAVSFADVFYILSYIFLGWGMSLAVASKRLNLELWQWAALAAVAVSSTALAIWVSGISVPGLGAQSFSSPDQAVVREVEIAERGVSDVGGYAAQELRLILAQAPEPDVSEIDETEETVEEGIEESSSAPAWVVALDERLEPLAFGVNLFYVIGDVVLLILATALILAFWGGRFSQSWRMIAFAMFSLYVADMYFKWADSRAEAEYESGALLEVFFVFTGILLAIGAVLEYDISTRSRQSRRSRRSSAKS